MSKPDLLRSAASDYLSVIHKASLINNIAAESLGDAVIQTDLDFNITGWNAAAEIVHGQPGAMGKNIFQLIEIDFIKGSAEELWNELNINGCWTGEVMFRRYDGQQIYFRTTATYIIDENGKPTAIMIVSHNINELKEKEKKLE